MAKTSSLIAVATVLALATAAYWEQATRIADLESRLAAAERELHALAPFASVFRAGGVGEKGVPAAWEPVQATGEPDAGAGESPLAWCPASENGGVEWIELGFPHGTVAASFRVVESHNPGAVHRITDVTPGRPPAELWSSPAAPRDRDETVLETPAFPEPLDLTRVRIELDTAAVAGWNEIDAVAAVAPDGTAVWAGSAESSSFWRRGAGE